MLKSITKLKKACAIHLSHRHETKILRSGKSHIPPITPKAEKSRKDNARKCKRCQALIDYLFGTVETVIKPFERMDPFAKPYDILDHNQPQDNLLLTKSINNNNNKPQAETCKVLSTTNKEQEEQLAQKIETIKETPIVEAEGEKSHDFPPRVLSKIYVTAENMSKDRRDISSLTDFFKENSKVSVETESKKSYEAKGNSFEDPLNHMGDKLCKEMERLGVSNLLHVEKSNISTRNLKGNREKSINKEEVELESKESEITSNTCSSEKNNEEVNAKARSNCQYNLNQHLTMYFQQVVKEDESKSLMTSKKNHDNKDPFDSDNTSKKPSPRRHKRKRALQSNVLNHTCYKDIVAEYNTRNQKNSEIKIEPSNTVAKSKHNKTTLKYERFIETKTSEPRLVIELIIPPETAHKTDTKAELNINVKRGSNFSGNQIVSDTNNDGAVEKVINLGLINETFSQCQPKTSPIKTLNNSIKHINVISNAYINADHLETYRACLNQILLDEIDQSRNSDKKNKDINIIFKPDNAKTSQIFYERRVKYHQTTPLQKKAYIDYLNQIVQDGPVHKNTDNLIKNIKTKSDLEQNPVEHMSLNFASEPTGVKTNVTNVPHSPVFHSSEANSDGYINKEKASEKNSPIGLLSNIGNTKPIKTSDANQEQYSSYKSMLMDYPELPKIEANNLPTLNVNDKNTFQCESNTFLPVDNVIQEQLILEKVMTSHLPNINLGSDPVQQTSDQDIEQLINVGKTLIDYPCLPDNSDYQTALSTPVQISLNNGEQDIRYTSTDHPLLSNVIPNCKDKQKILQSSCTSSLAKCCLAPNQQHIGVDKERPSFFGNRLPDKDPLLLDNIVIESDPEQQHKNTRRKSHSFIRNIPPENMHCHQYEVEISEKEEYYANSAITVDRDSSDLQDRPVSGAIESFYSLENADESETLAQSLLEEISKSDYAEASIGVQPLPSLNPANNKLSLTEMLRRVRLRSQIENIRQYRASKLITMANLTSLKSLESLETIDIEELKLKEEMYRGETAKPKEINDSESLEVTGKKCKTNKPPCPPPSAPTCPPKEHVTKPQRIPCPKTCEPGCPSGCPQRSPSCPKSNPCSRFTQTNMEKEDSFLEVISKLLSPLPLHQLITHTLSTPMIDDNLLGQCFSESSLDTKYFDNEDWDVGEVALVRDFEPWVPIPSWLPWPPKKTPKHPFMCPKEGCKDRPPYRLDPCAERGGKPCSNFPKRDR